MRNQDIDTKLAGISSIQVIRSEAGEIRTSEDHIIQEVPLEIRLSREHMTSVQLAITMRTPGSDEDLITGFLYTEGIIQSIEEISWIKIKDNIAEVQLSNTCDYDLTRIKRRLLMSSSCGVCGKTDIKSLQYTSKMLPWSSKVSVSIAMLSQMSQSMKEHQALFAMTGGSHAAALFSKDGELINIKEDIGRHNALDKLIGSSLGLHLSGDIICVSGRTSYEMVQKTAMYGAPILLSVGPASTLAIETAEIDGITLIGFMTDNRCNVYSAGHRVMVD